MQLEVFGQRIQKQVDSLRAEMDRRLSSYPADMSLAPRLQALEHALEATSCTVESLLKNGEKERRQLGLVEEWVKPLVVDVPDLTRKLRQIDSQLQKEVRDAMKPIEDMLSPLVVGFMKTLQLLGFTSEDACDKMGPWQEVIADLPRLLDHVYLRLRLKKGTTVLKLLRQKVDADHVRDLHIKLDTLLSCSSSIPIAWKHSADHQEGYCIPEKEGQKVPVAPPPRTSREDSSGKKPASTPRRPNSAGRRWACSPQGHAGTSWATQQMGMQRQSSDHSEPY
jgi:hypothetical protein